MTGKLSKLHAILSSPKLQPCHFSASLTHTLPDLSKWPFLHCRPSSPSPSLLSSSLSFNKLSLYFLFCFFLSSPYITKRKKKLPFYFVVAVKLQDREGENWTVFSATEINFLSLVYDQHVRAIRLEMAANTRLGTGATITTTEKKKKNTCLSQRLLVRTSTRMEPNQLLTCQEIIVDLKQMSENYNVKLFFCLFPRRLLTFCNHSQITKCSYFSIWPSTCEFGQQSMLTVITG